MLVDTLYELVYAIPAELGSVLDFSLKPEIVYFEQDWSAYGVLGTPVGDQVQQLLESEQVARLRLPAQLTFVEDKTSLVAFQELPHGLSTGLRAKRNFLIFGPLQRSHGEGSSELNPELSNPIIERWMVIGGDFSILHHGSGKNDIVIDVDIRDPMMISRSIDGRSEVQYTSERIPQVDDSQLMALIKEHLITGLEQLLTFQLPGRHLVEELQEKAAEVSRRCTILRSLTPDELREFTKERRDIEARNYRVLPSFCL